MKTVAAFTCLFIAFASTAASFAQEADVDWRLYGGAQVSGDDACFYDAKGVTQPTNGHIRVWTKCVGVQELNGVRLTSSQTEEAAQKIERGYVPPIVVMGVMPFQKIEDIVVAEEIADIGHTQPHSRILYEIDCSRKMLRELSANFQLNGKVGFSNQPSGWKYFSPETNGATLSKILCRSR